MMHSNIYASMHRTCLRDNEVHDLPGLIPPQLQSIFSRHIRSLGTRFLQRSNQTVAPDTFAFLSFEFKVQA